jgi:hypothetical protein
MNYAELCAAVESTVENTFTPEQLELFCRQTEQKVYNAVQIPALRKNSIGQLTLNNSYLTLPPDFLYVYSLAVIGTSGNYEFLLNKDVNYIREAYPYPGTTGVPKVYGQFDADSLILGPTPDDTYDVELHYGHYPESIVTAGNTWLGDNFDSVLYNGMLTEAARFMKAEEDIVALYNKMFIDALALLKQLGDGKLRRDSYRSGQTRVNVN